MEAEVAVGMTRLAIIDPTSGWQPLWNEDRSVAVVANGEIYNHIELRRVLEQRGHRLDSRSDCAVVPHLYEDHGVDFVHQLRGMFAIAVLDLRKRQLILVRDRMGEKPILLAEHDGRIAFASELSALVAAGLVPAEPDHEAIRLYYHWGFVPEPLSPLIRSRKLPAGSMLTIDLKSGIHHEQRWWNLEDAPPIVGDPTVRIAETLREISEITMRSDRPISVALSSGIDSSALAVMAQRHSSQPIQAISIGYPGSSFQDESHMAAEFAASLGLPFSRVDVRCEEVVAGFPELCIRRDEPIADIAGSAILALAKASRAAGAPVMLSGLGGDELFWGYRWHRECVAATLLAHRTRHRGLLTLGNYLRVKRPPVSIVGSINWMIDVGGLLSGVQRWSRDRAAPADQLVFWDEIREYVAAQRLLPSIAGGLLLEATADPAALFRGRDPLDRPDIALTGLICDTYLRSNGLAQTDRLFMSAGVEPRVPLVDYKLAETVVGLRKAHPDHEYGEKAWLRSALRGTLPDSILNRRKRGFTPPWRKWTTALYERFGEDLRGGALVSHGVLSERGAEIISKPLDALRRPTPLSFSSLVLEQWLRGMMAIAPADHRMPAGEPNLQALMSFHDRSPANRID